MSLQNLTRFPRLELIGAPTPLEYLPRLSDHLGREIFIKRDDVTPLAMGGNKLRKLEFLAADALREGADTLITAGAIQSNHVRQTAAVAAKLGLHCVALLENPIGTRAENYLTNGNRLLLDLFNTQVEMCDALTQPDVQLEELATRIEAQGYRPYVIPVAAQTRLARWAMWKARWKSPSSAKARWNSLPWWSPPAARVLMPDWPWDWNS
jgi:D-cysteine desulfhydrase